jgi:predicted RNA-binding protein with PIN domain
MQPVPIIVDGHNLIPKMPGLSLSAVDDEMRLVDVLQEYCRRQRKQIEVYFDNSPPGGVRARNLGLVVAKFVRQGMTADQAIGEKLKRLGKAARNWTVVSSDQAVRAAARAAQARSLSSEVFAGMVLESMENTRKDSGENPDVALPGDEVDEWMRLFRERKDKSD